MSDALSMGGYGFYVWASYALFLLLLVWDYLSPVWRERAALRRIALRQRREAGKPAPTATPKDPA